LNTFNQGKRFPLEGKVKNVIGNEIIINLGENSLVSKGDRFDVVRISNISGYMEKKEIATLIVEDVQPNFSKARVKSGLFSGSSGDIRIGDDVILNQIDHLKTFDAEKG